MGIISGAWEDENGKMGMVILECTNAGMWECGNMGTHENPRDSGNMGI